MLATAISRLTSPRPRDERRSSHRFRRGEQVLVCLFGREYDEEIHTLANRSRDGIYFETCSSQYRVGMPISVTPASELPPGWGSPSFGKIVRINQLADSGWGIAVKILMH